MLRQRTRSGIFVSLVGHMAVVSAPGFIHLASFPVSRPQPGVLLIFSFMCLASAPVSLPKPGVLPCTLSATFDSFVLELPHLRCSSLSKLKRPRSSRSPQPSSPVTAAITLQFQWLTMTPLSRIVIAAKLWTVTVGLVLRHLSKVSPGCDCPLENWVWLCSHCAEISVVLDGG